MSSLRLRRLSNEHVLLQQRFGGHPSVSVTSMGGDPPDRYRVEYRIAGLERHPDGKLVVRRSHQMEVVLPAEYPRMPAACRMLTPVFHPNIDAFTVCTSDFHSAQETLVDLIVRVGQMIAFQKHNIKSPLNAEAARWVEENEGRLPVDPVDLYPVEARVASAPGALTPFTPAVDALDEVVVTVRSKSTVPSRQSETLRVVAGERHKIGGKTVLLLVKDHPPRLVLAVGGMNPPIDLGTSDAQTFGGGDLEVRVAGCAATSVAVLGIDVTRWDHGRAEVRRFRNGVCTSIAAAIEQEVQAWCRGRRSDPGEFERLGRRIRDARARIGGFEGAVAQRHLERLRRAIESGEHATGQGWGPR